MPDRLVIPEKLYGREREVEALLAAFDRVVGGGAPELVLVSGYSGDRQILGRERAAQGAGAARAGSLLRANLTSSSATSPIRRWFRPSDAGAAVSWQERGGAGEVARGFSGGAGPERPTHRRPRPRTQARRRRAAAGSRTRAAAGAKPVPAHNASFHRRLCAARAAAGPFPRRSTMAGRCNA